MKKIFAFLILIFALSSCFWSENSDWLTTYSENPAFSIKLPTAWENITSEKDNIIPTPRSGQIELISRAKAETNHFLNNVLILSEDVKQGSSLTDYINSMNFNAKNDYFEYSEIKSKDFVFSDGTISKINIFSARYNDSTPRLNFLQTVNICPNSKAYFITLAIDNTITDTSRYENMLSSFNCKK